MSVNPVAIASDEEEVGSEPSNKRIKVSDKTINVGQSVNNDEVSRPQSQSDSSQEEGIMTCAHSQLYPEALSQPSRRREK